MDPANRIYDLQLNPAESLKPGQGLARLISPDKLPRFHPHWFVKNLESVGEGFKADIRDYATGARFTISFSTAFKGPDSMTVAVEGAGNLKGFTISRTERGWQAEAGFASEPTATEERDVQLWLRGIREYVRLYLSANPLNLFFRLVMNKMMLRMNPSQRKITVMLWKITIVEIAVIILIIAAYFLFIQPA